MFSYQIRSWHAVKTDAKIISLDRSCERSFWTAQWVNMSTEWKQATLLPPVCPWHYFPNNQCLKNHPQSWNINNLTVRNLLCGSMWFDWKVSMETWANNGTTLSFASGEEIFDTSAFQHYIITIYIYTSFLFHFFFMPIHCSSLICLSSHKISHNHTHSSVVMKWTAQKKDRMRKIKGRAEREHIGCLFFLNKRKRYSIMSWTVKGYVKKSPTFLQYTWSVVKGVIVEMGLYWH